MSRQSDFLPPPESLLLTLLNIGTQQQKHSTSVEEGRSSSRAELPSMKLGNWGDARTNPSIITFLLTHKPFPVPCTHNFEQ